MIFTCNTRELSQAIDAVSCCLAPRPAKASYEYILLDASDGTVSVSATDGSMYMTASIEVPDGDIRDSGVMALDGKLLQAVIGKQSGGVITLTGDEKACKIECGKAKTQLPLRPAEDFPDPPPVAPDSRSVTIKQKDLRTCIDYVSFCTSIDQSRKVLTGVLLEFENNFMQAVGLDGFRMAMHRAPCEFESEKKRCVVPKPSIVEIAKMLSEDGDSTVTLRLDGDYLHLWAGKRAFSTVLLTGEYIDYHRLIREDCQTKSLIDARQLRACVERAQVMASSGKNDLIHLRFENDTLTITSNSMEGQAYDELDVGLQGQPLSIAFNCRYLADMLKRETEGSIDVEMQGGVSPAIIRPLDNKERMQLVLPVRILNGKSA